MFLYPNTSKGYKLYDILHQQVFVSRNVAFHEEHFPFYSVASASALIDPFHDLILPLPVHGEILEDVSDGITSSTSSSYPDQS